jgi:uncharacterized protein (DUF885 family)
MSDREEFDALIEEFYPVWFRFHPDLAVSLGIKGGDSPLPATDDDDLSALGVWLENFFLEVAEIDASALDPDRRIDRRLVLESAQLEYRELLTRDWRHLDPIRFLPVHEVFLLTLHPPESLRETMLSLLKAVPGHLRHARARLGRSAELVSPDMVRVAVEEAAAGADYLTQLAGSAWLRHKCGGAGMHQACDEAVEAVRGYQALLRDEIAPRAQGPLGCGEEYLSLVLRHRHCIELSPDSLRTYIQALFRDTKRRLDRHRQEHAGELARAECFSGDRRLKVYREEINQLREYIRRRGVVSLPGEPLRIVERPACPQPGECGSGYLRDTERHGGVFFISGKGGGEGGETRAQIRSHCIRQGWSGAHLLAFGGGEQARALPRRLAPAGAFAEAWDLYVRQLLSGIGYFGPGDREVELAHQLHAINLALVDLDLNTGGDVAWALRRLNETEDDEHHAHRQMVELARRPGDALAGVVGWMLLHQARELQQAVNPEFSVGEFHDSLLRQGPVPPSLLIPHLFGDELWMSVQKELAV